MILHVFIKLALSNKRKHSYFEKNIFNLHRETLTLLIQL